jgi:hypothetical protein
VDLADIQGTADYLLTRARIDCTEPVNPFALAFALGVHVVPGAPRGCHGAVANDPPVAWISMRGSEIDRCARLAHELAHLGCAWTGERAPHDERDVDAIAAAILVPSGWVRIACYSLGRTVDEMPALHPFASARMVVERARWVLRCDVAADEAA